MPTVELFGREYTIPFDPEVIAGLQYKGLNVFPDQGIDQDQINAEALAIKPHLDKLWQDQKLRTVPGGMETPPGRIENPPVKEQFETGMSFAMPQFQGPAKKFTAMKTMPTPKTSFHLRDIAEDQIKRRALLTDI
jgi:hypothetical protein